MKLWGGRFSKATNQLVDEFNASIGFDRNLAEYDIQGSLAHASMLKKCGIITSQDAEKIITGLEKILSDIRNNRVEFRLADEDIHMNIERLLHEAIGEVAGKLHSGRSRNDQVATDIHLYLREKSLLIHDKLLQLMSVLQQIASEHVDTVLPGYTHLQRAEPVRFAHHMLAYFNMFSRDVARLQDGFKRINQSPLGAGALAGSGLPVDRDMTAELLGFDDNYANSLDAVSDRDFIAEFLFAASLIMMHVSRLSEEIILWNTQEFSFIQLDDSFSTGSSMMPQKKNPDVAELARGKTGRVYGALTGLLTTLKGLPLAYNKDMQEDKEGLFDTVNTLSMTLTVFTGMLDTMTIDKEKMRLATEQDYSNATNLANYLTIQGMPFREAHEVTGKIVSHCITTNTLLINLPLEDYQQFSNMIKQDLYQHLTTEAVIEAHAAKGGTSRASVEQQLNDATTLFKQLTSWQDDKNQLLQQVSRQAPDHA